VSDLEYTWAAICLGRKGRLDPTGSPNLPRSVVWQCRERTIGGHQTPSSAAGHKRGSPAAKLQCGRIIMHVTMKVRGVQRESPCFLFVRRTFHVSKIFIGSPKVEVLFHFHNWHLPFDIVPQEEGPRRYPGDSFR
jgi:hypothetical protein